MKTRKKAQEPFRKKLAAVHKRIKVLEFLPDAAGYVSSIFLIGAVVLILAEILSRQFTSRSIKGVYEISGWLMAGITWTALGYTAKEEGHVQVRLVTDRLPPQARKVMDVILYAVGTATIIFLVIAMRERLQFFGDRGQVGNEIRIQIYWIYLACFAGSVVLLLGFIMKLWESVLIALGVIEPPPPADDDSSGSETR